MKYFITGATGFIGGHIARQLREAGHDVVALVRDPSKASDLSAQGVQLAQGDITDKESMRVPMKGAEGVFHMAGWYKVGARDASMAEAINVDGTRNVLEVMKELRTPRGVYASTLAIFGDTRGEVKDENYVYHGKHLSHYGETKWRAHHEIAAPMIREGLPLIIVQPGVVYGPGDPSGFGQTFRLWLRGLVPLIPAKASFCWAHIDDTARGCILAMQKGMPGETYILAGPVYSLPEVFQLAAASIGRRPPLIQAGPGLMRLNAAIMSVLGVVIPLPEPFAAETMRYTAEVSNLGSSARAERELGFTVRPIELGLRQTLEFELQMMGKAPRPGTS